jgi:hypothetical protein
MLLCICCTCKAMSPSLACKLRAAQSAQKTASRGAATGKGACRITCDGRHCCRELKLQAIACIVVLSLPDAHTRPATASSTRAT